MATGQAQIGGEIFEVTDGDLQVRPMGGTIVNIDVIDMLSAGTVSPWGFTTTISQTPTIGTVAYTANDAVGGTLTFANPVRAVNKGGLIKTALLIDDDKEDAATDLVLFSAAFTATPDADAFDVTDADLENCIGVIQFGTADYHDFNDNSIAVIQNVDLAFTASGTSSLYGQLVTRGTPTYTAVTDLTVKLVIQQD